MATFQIVVSDPETGESHQFEVDDQAANRFVGREMGDEIEGAVVGLDGYTLELAGGSDNAGRPMRRDVAGPNLREVLLAERSTGYKPARDGERKRVSVRGSEYSDAVAQINTKIVDRGEQSIDDLLRDQSESEDANETDEE